MPKTKLLILGLVAMVGLLILPGISKAGTVAPFVTVTIPAGDGNSDYQLPESIPVPGLFGVYLIFREELSIAGKSAVEGALTAGSDKALTYNWGPPGGPFANLLEISNLGSTATFANDVIADVSYLAGGTDPNLLIIDSSQYTDTETLIPNGAGSETSISFQVPNSTEHWDKVSKTDVDNSTYVLVYDTSGNYLRDLYVLPDHTGSGTINSVMVHARLKEDATNDGFGRISLKTAGTVYDTDPISLTTSFADYSNTWTTNPSTNQPWTWDEIDSLEAGVSLWGYGSPSSILKGQPVLMADGSQKNIEDIQVGDSITSFNVDSKKTEEDKVTQVMPGSHDDYLIFNGTLKTSLNHVIWASGEFKEAKDIKEGDFLLNSEGQEIEVTQIDYVKEKVDTYDLATEKNHNFFVDNYLVHNTAQPFAQCSQVYVVVGYTEGGNDSGRTVTDPTPEKILAEVAGNFISLEGDDPTQTENFTFNTDYTFENGDASISIPSGTVVTQTGGGDLNLTLFTTEDNTAEIQDENGDAIGAVRIGIPNLHLTFSKPITISIPVGSEYNGQTLTVSYRSEGSTDWKEETTCDVDHGLCTFQTDHATTYMAEGGEAQSAKITSWKAVEYAKPDTSCVQRVKLTLKGRHFDKDAEVKIGGQKASDVDRKSSQELTAKFCLKKLLNIQTSLKRSISVTNPDADKEKADKKINLGNLPLQFSADDFTMQTTQGIKNIQTALVKLGLLDQESITGFYGPLTTQAVSKFQAQNGIEQTGTVGPLTKAKLAEMVK